MITQIVADHLPPVFDGEHADGAIRVRRNELVAVKIAYGQIMGLRCERYFIRPMIGVVDEHLNLRRESVAIRIGIVRTCRIEMRELERGDIRRQGIESAPEPVVHHADADIGKNGILHPFSIFHSPFYIR